MTEKILTIIRFSIKEAVADGLINTLSAANHKSFVKMTGIEDQEDYLASKKEEDLRDALQRHQADSFSKAFGYGANAT